MLSELKDIYKENIDWLNFAELKNGALITVAGVILGLMDNMECKLIPVLCLIIILFSGSSFVPFLNNNKTVREIARKYYIWTRNKNCVEASNIIFYIAIFLSSREEYARTLKKIVVKDDDYIITELENNYIEQVYQISSITSIKYFLFTLAFIVFVVMMVLFGGELLFS